MTVGEALPARGRSAAAGRRIVATALALAALVIGIRTVATSGWYEPGDDIGYGLGVAGGTLMLLLLVYPLRKRLGVLRNAGKTRSWLALHMLLGIGGPVLILLHSTFHLGSLNAAVAFWSMVIVASSGVAGRYFYTQIHHGLTGERATLAELRAQAGLASSEVHAGLRMAPEVEGDLLAFATQADEVARSGLRRPGAFLGLALYGWRTRRRCRRGLQRALAAYAEAHRWDAATRVSHARAATALIDAYVDTAKRVARFGAFERLFALWHVAHVPLVFTLVLSAVAHVVAVHLY